MKNIHFLQIVTIDKISFIKENRISKNHSCTNKGWNRFKGMTDNLKKNTKLINKICELKFNYKKCSLFFGTFHFVQIDIGIIKEQKQNDYDLVCTFSVCSLS